VPHPIVAQEMIARDANTASAGRKETVPNRGEARGQRQRNPGEIDMQTSSIQGRFFYLFVRQSEHSEVSLQPKDKSEQWITVRIQTTDTEPNSQMLACM
jgi:hypothetical protein